MAELLTLGAARASVLGLSVTAGLTFVLSCASSPTPGRRSTVEVRGIIRDRDGMGVEGVGVLLDPADDDQTILTGVPTDGKGSFKIRVRPGPYRVILDNNNSLRVPTAYLDTIWLTPPTARLDYQYGGIKVEGRLLGPGGMPIQSGSIQALGGDLSGYLNTVEASVVGGHYMLFVPPGRYYFESKPLPARFPSFEGREIDISTDTTIDFSAEGNQLIGRVVLGAEGPMPDAEVYANGSAAGLPVSAHDETRRDGSFRLYLPPGGYTFQVVPGASHAFVVPRLFSRAVSVPQTIDLDMSGTVWSGTVRDTITGSPLRLVRVVAAFTLASSISAVSVSDGEGRFRLVLQPGHVYTLSLSSSDGRIVPKQVSRVRAGNDSALELFARVSNR